MILSDIKRYLSERGQATLADMALHFQSSPDAVRGMLEVWTSCGSSCSKCDPASVEIYEWIGDGATEKIRIIQPPGNC